MCKGRLFPSFGTRIFELGKQNWPLFVSFLVTLTNERPRVNIKVLVTCRRHLLFTIVQEIYRCKILKCRQIPTMWLKILKFQVCQQKQAIVQLNYQILHPYILFTSIIIRGMIVNEMALLLIQTHQSLKVVLITRVQANIDVIRTLCVNADTFRSGTRVSGRVDVVLLRLPIYCSDITLYNQSGIKFDSSAGLML